MLQGLGVRIGRRAADHGVGGDVCEHERTSTDPCPVPDADGAQDGCPCSEEYPGADLGVTGTAASSAAEGDSVEDEGVIAD